MTCGRINSHLDPRLSLSAVTPSMEICGLNQRSDDTQPSAVVLSVLGHEVDRKHTIIFSFFLKHKADTNAHTHTHRHTECVAVEPLKKCLQSDMHTLMQQHTSPPLVPRVTHPEIPELRPFQFFTS